MNTLGVLSLQGGFARHLAMAEKCCVRSIPVRSAGDLDKCDGLIIPGGESTTIGMLLKRRELDDPIRKFIASGRGVFGTCAGLILLSGKISGRSELSFDSLDVGVERNSYGSQVDSFEAEIDIAAAGSRAGVENFPAVFIRAPRITSCGPGVEVLSSFNGDPVLVRQGNILAASFHPELTDDMRIHRFFIDNF